MAHRVTASPLPLPNLGRPGRAAAAASCVRARRFNNDVTTTTRATATALATAPSASAPAATSATFAAADTAAYMPVVDLAASDDECVAIVRDACDGVGFFHVVNRGVEAGLIKQVVAAGAAFFDLPLPEKRALVRGEMRLSRGSEISPEHIAVMLQGVSAADEAAAAEPSAAHRILSEQLSVGPFIIPKRDDNYYSGERGSLFFAPSAWPSLPSTSNLRPAMETYFARMETLSKRLHRLLAAAMGASPDFFDQHRSNLLVANYPTIGHRRWEADPFLPPRKKAHADSGTLTILARGAETEGAAGGLQVLLDGSADVSQDTWLDDPVFPGGVFDGDAAALLVNLGNQTQRWSDDRWRSTKHRVTNHDPPPAAASAVAAAAASRRLSIAFFHNANYDAVVDPSAFVPEGVVSGRNPRVESGDISRVGLLRQASERGLSAREASLAYHEEIIGAEAEAATTAAAAAAAANAAADGDEGLVLDRGKGEEGAGMGDNVPAQSCPVCGGTGWKPCGQCGGTGVNQEDLFGGKFVRGDTCWLCAGKSKTMCGNCVDLTDSF